MKDKSKNRFHRSDLAVFFSFFRPHLGLFALDMSCAVAVAVIDLAFPYITRVSMQTLLPEKLYTTFFVIMAAMFAAYILKGVMYYLITVLGHRMGVYIEADMRHAVFNHMQRLSFSFFDRNRTGALMSRITSDLFEITELAHHGPEDILISVLTIIGSLIVLAGIEWRLALVLAVCLPLLILFTLSRRVSMKRANIEVKRQTAEINAAIESGISGIRTAKAFANEQAEDEKFVAANERYKAARSRYFKAMGGFMSGMEFTTSVMQVLVVAAGGALIMGGRMDYVDLVTFSLYVSTFVTPVRKLASFSEVYMQGTAGFSRFLELMRTEPDVQDAPDAVELRDVKGEVEYRDVSFSYNDEAGPVLEHVSLKIAPGEKLAVVGPSGRQDHALPAAAEVLRRDGRGRAGGRRGRAPRDAGFAAAEHRHNPAGRVHLRGDHPREYPLRPPRGDGRRGRGRRRAGGDTRGDNGHAGRLRQLRGRAGRHALGRAEAAAQHRAGVPQKPADFGHGRGDERARHGD